MFGNFLNKNGIKSAAKYVEYGYGQVEPNHLSAQYNGQIYAQLPAAASIDKLEQGQFVKYNYADGVVDFGGTHGVGEWMLVYNEIKLYRDNQMDCEFAMIKDNYEARVYSPFGGRKDDINIPDTVDFNGQGSKQSRYYNGVDAKGRSSYTLTLPEKYVAATTYDANTTYYSKDDETGEYEEATLAEAPADITIYFVKEIPTKTYAYDDVTAGPDMYEPYYNEDPFHIEGAYKEAMMPEGTKMVPRVFKTMVGDIYTTNTVDEETLAVGDILVVRSQADANTANANLAADAQVTPGLLYKSGTTLPASGMAWQVVKVYTMPDHQKGVKIMRVQ